VGGEGQRAGADDDVAHLVDGGLLTAIGEVADQKLGSSLIARDRRELFEEVLRRHSSMSAKPSRMA